MNIEFKSRLARAKEKTVNLGYANGWNQETRDFYKIASDNIVPQSGKSTEIGRCLNVFEFDFKVDDEVYHLVYKVDSSD